MQSKQGTHTMPVLKHTPPLIGTGAERTIAHTIGDTFAYKARLDGTITKINKDDQTMEITYSDKTKAYVNIGPRTVKNSVGGFYINTQLTPTSKIKVGSKVKAEDIVAFDSSYFGETVDGDIMYKAGVLVRAAVTALDQTFEDSLMVTHKLISDTISEVIMMRPVSLTPNTNLQSIVSVGDKTTPNSALAVFEVGTDDADVAELLNKIGDEFEEAISELSRNVSTAKYAGEIVELRVYYNVPEEELSPSLNKFIKKQRSITESKQKRNTGTRTGDSIKVYQPEYTTRGKVNGEEFNGVLILIYIKCINESATGDKYVSQSPLKGIVSQVLEEGEEPYSEDGKNVDYIVSPLSIVSRMTVDVFLQLWCNAILIKLKEEVLKIYNE